MIKLSNISLGISSGENVLKSVAAEKLSTTLKNVEKVEIIKKSLDARKKNDLKYVYTIKVKLYDERLARLKNVEFCADSTAFIDNMEVSPLKGTYAVIGSGPCGLFAALTLIKRGVTPIVLERGLDVDKRMAEIEKLNSLHILNEECNVQFGEGGAGTYSDGKLNTGTKSEYIETVINEFVRFGAPEEIKYLSKPHIGTDILRTVVKNMREYIISRGGKVLFNAKVTDIKIEKGKLTKIYYASESLNELNVDGAIFAIGHSARDTFKLLLDKGAAMERKPFSIGVRIEHLQKNVNKAQYGVESSPYLPAADYKLAAHTNLGRGIYTFCMCPGGEVVAAASEKNRMVTNGMSYHARNLTNANSALLVSVEPSDFGGEGVLAGVEFQRKYEGAAYELSGGYKAPITRLGDFLNGKKSVSLGEVIPSIKSGYTLENVRKCLPQFVADGISFGAAEFDKKLKGFASPDSVLSGVETRSSSPVRIIRDENNMSNIVGLYPAGEGAGYAGGITSAAVDGIKTALKVR